MINPWKSQSKINPQPEDGYRRINSEILLALIASNLSASEFKMIFFIIHLTWGFGKYHDVITQSQIAGVTKLSERMIQYVIKSLRDKHIIHYQPSKIIYHGNAVNEYMFNKHYDTWKCGQPVDNEGCNTLQGCNTLRVKGAMSFVEGCNTLRPSIDMIKITKDSISKSSLKSNNKSDYEVDRLIIKNLSKIATTKGIINTLMNVEENKWYKVREYLNKRYTPDGNKGYNKAVIEIKKGDSK